MTKFKRSKITPSNYNTQSQKLVSAKQKKCPIRKNKLPQKFRATRYTHLACFVSTINYHYHFITSLSSNSLMRPVGWGGFWDGMPDQRAGLHLPFIPCLLSVFMVNFSFSYNTLFLSSLGFVAAQYAPSGVSLHENAKFKGAVSRQSSSFCFILPITRPQSLWNLK